LEEVIFYSIEIINIYGTVYFIKMKTFFTANSEAGAGLSPREQSIEAVRTNIFWIDKREADLIQNLTEPL
jgi:hypothetical protein